MPNAKTNQRSNSFFFMKRSKKQRIGENIKNKVETNKEQEVEQRIINKYII